MRAVHTTQRHREARIVIQRALESENAVIKQTTSTNGKHKEHASLSIQRWMTFACAYERRKVIVEQRAEQTDILLDERSDD